MRHALTIKVSKNRANGGILTCRQVTLREKFLHFLLGNPIRLTVLGPGDSVDEVVIREVTESEDESQ